MISNEIIDILREPDPHIRYERAHLTKPKRDNPIVCEFLKFVDNKRYRKISNKALEVGFKFCWQEHDYRIIVRIARRLPKDRVIDNHGSLLQLWYDGSIVRLSG